MQPVKAPSHIRGPVYYGAMDGLRGILAVCVAIYHTFWFSHINSTAFFNNGAVIIDLFFVFSGFLMYTLYHKRLSTPEQAATFLKRRFARLYPIHFVMLMVFVVFALARLWAHHVGLAQADPGEIVPFAAGSPDSVFNIFAHLTLTHAMGVTDSLTFNAPSWTISVEFFAYFVFVLMYMRMPPTKAWHFGLIAVGVGLIYFGLSLVKPDLNITYDFAFWRCLAGFYLGVLTAWSVENLRAKMVERNIEPSVGVMTALEFTALMTFVLFIIYMPGKMQFFVAPFAFFMVVAFAFDRGWVCRIFSWSPFLYLAKISYSVYMVHSIFAIVIYMFGSRLFPIITEPGNAYGDLLLVPYLLIVIGTSHFTWKYIERPGQKWIESWKLRRSERDIKTPA